MNQAFTQVSIIIPCYNAGDYIGEAIESGLVQTYSNVEVIVIDDGSTDGSLEVIRSFGDRIRWETGPNRGGSAARNRGIRLARGELIQFLDADDLLYPDKLTKMVPQVVSQGVGTAVICDWERMSEAGGPALELQRLNYGGEDPVVFCLRSQLPILSPVHWKKNLDQVGGFDESLPCSQERDLHLRLACYGIRFVYVPEVLFQVRRRPNSVSADYNRVLQQHGRIFSRSYEFLKENGGATNARAMVFAEALARDARQCLRRGDKSIAKEYFRRADSIHREGALRAFRRTGLRTAARFFGPRTAEHLCQLALKVSIRT